MITSVMLAGLPISIAVYGAYKRFVPALGVKQERLNHLDGDSYALLDVRAYNVSDKKPAPEAFNLPISYFTRGYGEIPKKPIHLIAENKLEKNLAVRLLRRKGFSVASYSLMGEKSPDKLNTACC